MNNTKAIFNFVLIVSITTSVCSSPVENGKKNSETANGKNDILKNNGSVAGKVSKYVVPPKSIKSPIPAVSPKPEALPKLEKSSIYSESPESPETSEYDESDDLNVIKKQPANRVTSLGNTLNNNYNQQNKKWNPTKKENEKMNSNKNTSLIDFILNTVVENIRKFTGFMTQVLQMNQTILGKAVKELQSNLPQPSFNYNGGNIVKRYPSRNSNFEAPSINIGHQYSNPWSIPFFGRSNSLKNSNGNNYGFGNISNVGNRYTNAGNNNMNGVNSDMSIIGNRIFVNNGEYEIFSGGNKVLSLPSGTYTNLKGWKKLKNTKDQGVEIEPQESQMPEQKPGKTINKKSKKGDQVSIGDVDFTDGPTITIGGKKFPPNNNFKTGKVNMGGVDSNGNNTGFGKISNFGNNNSNTKNNINVDMNNHNNVYCDTKTLEYAGKTYVDSEYEIVNGGTKTLRTSNSGLVFNDLKEYRKLTDSEKQWVRKKLNYCYGEASDSAEPPESVFLPSRFNKSNESEAELDGDDDDE